MSINSRLAKLSWRSTPWIKKIKLQQWSRLLDGVAKLNLAVPKIDVVQDLLEGLAVRERNKMSMVEHLLVMVVWLRQQEQCRMLVVSSLLTSLVSCQQFHHGHLVSLPYGKTFQEVLYHIYLGKLIGDDWI